MIGDDDSDNILFYNKSKAQDEFLRLFDELEGARLICNKIYKEYGKIVKIKKIYAKQKSNWRNEYYQITYERSE